MRSSNRVVFSLIFVIMLSMAAFAVTGDFCEDASAISTVDNDSVKSIAHRGYSVAAPENTLPAYQLAHDMGFVYVETDIAITKDDKVVLLHDSYVDRTSNGSGKISNMTLEEAKKLDFGSWKDPIYAGTTIPTLDEFLDLCKTLGLKPYIELKLTLFSSYSASQIHGIVDTVIAHDMLDDTTFISMDYSYLETIRDYEKHVRLGFIPLLIVTTSTIERTLDLRTGYNEVFIDTQFYDDSACELCKEAGIPLEAWTIDDPEVMESLNMYISGVTSNSLKYSDYRPTEYTVKFISNGGSPVDDIKYTSKSEQIVLPMSTRNGYSFDGWYVNAELSGDRISTIEPGSSGDMVLYASWVLLVYTATFDSGSGSYVEPILFTVESERIILPESSLIGYTFDGWSDPDGNIATAIEPGSVGDRTYHAMWSVGQYTIKFYSNGGSEVSDIQYGYGETVILPESTRIGYTFDGWYDNVELTGDKVSVIVPGSVGDRLFYAKWLLVEYVVKFVANGGQEMADTTYNIESERIMLNDSSRSGYSFAGWYSNQDLSGERVTYIEHGSTGNKTFYAKWEQNAVADNNTLEILGIAAVILVAIICASILIWKKRVL